MELKVFDLKIPAICNLATVVLFFWVFCICNGNVSCEQVSAGKSAGEIWIEPSTGIKFIRIPHGSFMMGSLTDEEGRDTDEGPVHKVILDAFWISCYEVTVGQFSVFVNRTGYVTEAEREGYSWIYTRKWERRKGYSWKNTGFEQTEDHPVVNVSWNDAKKMAEWLTRISGKKIRLPTEAEWEYACRAGTSTSRFWGNEPDKACAYANVADITAKGRFPAWNVHECTDGFIFTAPVGSFKANPYGLFDMLGNVWEWCEDTYLIKSYGRKPQHNPLVKTKGVSDLVIRGGSWYSRPRYVRCASRDHLHDSHRRGNDVGFRLVMKP